MTLNDILLEILKNSIDSILPDDVEFVWKDDICFLDLDLQEDDTESTQE